MRALAPLCLLALAGCATPQAPSLEEYPLAETAPAEPNPPAVAPSRPVSLAQVERKKSGRDHSIPFYLQKRPTLAIQLSGHWMGALGADASAGSTSLSSAKAAELAVEYQPRWIQGVGVVSVGGHLRHHLESSAKRITGYGLRVAYQAKWFTHQWLVPVAGYALDQINYSLNNGATGTLGSPGLYYGVRLFLSAADPAAAAEFYNGFNVSRAYLTIETTERKASNADLSVSGRSTSVGLRFEF